MPPIKKKLSLSPQPLKQGMILPFILIVLVLMALMGMQIIISSKAEMQISSSTSLGRNAFMSSDGAEQISMLMARMLLYPELGSPESILVNSNPAGSSYTLKVEIVNPNLFNLKNLKEESKLSNRTQLRYIRAGSAPGRVGAGGVNLSPHIIFKAKNKDNEEQLVAASAVSIEKIETITPGSSLGEGNGYESTNAPSTKIIMAVSTIGQPLGNFDNKAAATFDGVETSTPRSVTSSIFVEIK